ncbi:1316_t:CDS:2 [Cetraspora pellucida]|uniref:1316_t:CDS:1 n=1 Tax=Cetraspora pellucida TaxID=1433469 RepID=A0A9N9IIR3_9GLOM|nr:1316_t:CDS:2 [Cetraspora pellucida]
MAMFAIKQKKRCTETAKEQKICLEYRRNQQKKIEMQKLLKKRKQKMNIGATNEREKWIQKLMKNEKNILHITIIENIRERKDNDRESTSKEKKNVRPCKSQLSESNKKLLNTFCNKMTIIKNELCLTCHEQFPFIILYQEDVSQELQGLTNIEEMLIAQVFSIVSVYNLHRGQYAYRGNIINFPQDLQGFVTCLSHHLSSLSMLIIQ